MDPFDLNDREISAYTLTRQRIVSQIDDIETKGGSAGTLKRLKRFGNAFSWYPQFYPQILEDIGGMTDKQLMSALRTEESFMRLIAPVKGLPIHHKFASRTGGDVPIRTPADVFLDVRKRVYDKFGFGPGNNPINLGAQGAIDERMHQGRFGSKGTVFEESRGLGMAPTEELPILHGKGTRDIGGKLGQDPALLRSQSDEIFNAIEPFLDTQLDKYNEVVQNPVTIKQRSIIQEGIDPEAFDVGRTTEQSTAVRKAAEQTGLDIKFASAFDFSKGTATLKNLIKTPAGRMVLAGTGLTAVGALTDVSAVQASVSTPRTDDIGQLERDFSGLAGIAGLATLTPAAPVAAPISLAFSGAGVATEYRRKRDEELERTRQYMDPANRRYIGDSVITKTKPKLPTSFTGRL